MMVSRIYDLVRQAVTCRLGSQISYIEFRVPLCPLLQHGFFSFLSSSSAASRLSGFACCFCCRLGDFGGHPIRRCRHYVWLISYLFLLVKMCDLVELQTGSVQYDGGRWSISAKRLMDIALQLRNRKRISFHPILALITGCLDQDGLKRGQPSHCNLECTKLTASCLLRLLLFVQRLLIRLVTASAL